jgi:hypothetical protein
MEHIVADLILSSASELDIKLNHAVNKAIDLGRRDGQNGILVTRHDYSTFAVALTSEVPYGLIHEHDKIRHG